MRLQGTTFCQAAEIKYMTDVKLFWRIGCSLAVLSLLCLLGCQRAPEASHPDTSGSSAVLSSLSSSSQVEAISSGSGQVGSIPSSSSQVERASSSSEVEQPSSAASSEPVQSSKPSVQIAEPASADQFIDTLEPEWYGGVYYKEGTMHILAVSEFYPMLAGKVSEEYDGENGEPLTVDDPSGATVYSLTELAETYEQLSEISQKYHIVGLATFLEPEAKERNGVEVVIDEAFAITEEQKSSIVEQLAVKNLRFVLGAEDNPNT